MQATMASLGLDKLTGVERIALAHELLGSVEPGSAMSSELAAELDRRVAEDDANPDDLIPWEQVRSEARANYMQLVTR